MLDAYTVRKAIPRIVIAVIAINLSIFMCVALIDITNVVGRGLGQLITEPFKTDEAFGNQGIGGTANNIFGGATFVLTFLAGTLIWKLLKGKPGGAVSSAAKGLIVPAAIILIPFIISILLISLAIVFTLVIRQALLVFLTVISPVAMALFVLPGTEKYFKKWFDLFIKTLMVYPIVAIIFAVSSAMTSVIIGNSNAGGGLTSPAQAIAAVVVAFAPLVMIPFAFKLAGGAIAAISSAASGQASNLSGRTRQGLQKWRSNPNSLAGKLSSEAKDARIRTGLTGRQMWASRRGGANRAERIQSARSLDERLAREELSGTDRHKYKSQDSDVMRSGVMTAEQVENDRKAQRAILNDATSTADEKIMAQSKLNGHTSMDQIGRTQASAMAAFVNPERIKFSNNTYEEELAIAERIHGPQGAIEAMSEFQYVAKSTAGRPDLAGNVQGKSRDPHYGIGSQSAYTLMNQARPEAIENFIGQSFDILSTPIDPALSGDALEQEKESRRRTAAQLEAISSGKSGGTEANIAKVNERRVQIAAQLEDHVRGEAMEILATTPGRVPTKKPTGRQISAPDPHNPGQTIIDSESVAMTAADRFEQAKRIAGADLSEMSLGYSQIDPSLRDK